MTASAYAWILTDHSGHSFAVANVEMVEYLTEASPLQVPLSPGYSPAVIPWRDRLIPLVFYHRLFEPGSAATLHHIGILAYQRQPGAQLQHIAVELAQAPYRVVVTDEESGALPERYRDPVYAPLVRSVFNHNESPIPVLDVNYLVSAALRNAWEEKTAAA